MSKPAQNSQDESGRVARLDGIDERILRLLRDDGRMSVRAIAEQLGISRTNAYDRIERMRESGVISGYTVVVDPAALGLDVAAYILLRLKQNTWATAAPLVRQIPEVKYAAMVTGAVDMVLFVRTQDVASLRDLLMTRIQSLPQVMSTETVLVLEEIQRGTDQLVTGPDPNV